MNSSGFRERKLVDMKHKILIVDDEPANLRVLERLLSREYTVITANTGSNALDLLLQHDIALIISDQRMPEMTGLDFLKQAAKLRQQTVRILLTGYTDVETLVEAINSGVVYQYVTKPWSNDDLLQTIRRSLAHHESVKQSHFSKLNISRLNRKLEASRKGLLRVWSEVIKLRSPDLLSHAERISGYARTLGELLSLDSEKIESLAMAAYLFPSVYGVATTADLLAGAAITESEIGIRTVELESGLALFSEIRAIDEFAEIEDIIRFANEYFNGTGFPKRLAQDRIPLASRILAVVRGYDLLTSAPIEEYQLTHEDALNRMNELSGRIFDPEIVGLLTGLGFVSQIPESLVSPHSRRFQMSPCPTWQIAG